jgi:hypothetical protein
VLAASAGVRFALVLVAACTAASPAGDPITSRVERRIVPLDGKRELDVLFVVDNSPAMLPYRDGLLANAALLVNDFERRFQGLLDLHIGIVTADVGSRGAGDASAPATAGCNETGDAGAMHAASSVAGNFLVDPITRERNFAGTLEAAFADSLAAVLSKPDGCWLSRPLEAMRIALHSPANAGFLREHARLALVFLTPSDDCSFVHASDTSCASGLVPLDEYEAEVRSAKVDPSVITLGGAFLPAAPPPRLLALFDRFPNRAMSVSLFDPYDVVDLLEPFDPKVSNSCMDLAPTGACLAWLAHANGDQDILPPCGPTSDVCWELVDDPIDCPAPSAMQRFTIGHRVPDDPVTAVIECVTD